MLPDRKAVTVVIPARYASTRFPGKPLAELAGKPLIQHVHEQASRVPGVMRVLVATDDPRIQQTVEQFGGLVWMIDTPCRTGSDRVAEVARFSDSPVFVNLQADEILLAPTLMTDLIDSFLTSDAEMGTLKRRITATEDFHRSSVVKVVTDQQGRALYFSRAPIPHARNGGPGESPKELFYLHLGVYIYLRETLLRFAELPSGVLEKAEQLEQLRALEHGIPIRVWETAHQSLRIDTPEDLEAAQRQWDRLVVS